MEMLGTDQMSPYELKSCMTLVNGKVLYKSGLPEPTGTRTCTDSIIFFEWRKPIALSPTGGSFFFELCPAASFGTWHRLAVAFQWIPKSPLCKGHMVKSFGSGSNMPTHAKLIQLQIQVYLLEAVLRFNGPGCLACMISVAQQCCHHLDF